MKYLINVLFILVICMPGSHLSAFGYLPADEVRTPITGNTAEGEPGLVNIYAESFTLFFADNGTVKRKIGEQRKTGKWRVTESRKLCIEWKGKKEKCAPVYNYGEADKRVTKQSSGRVLWEIKFIRFTGGYSYT